MKELRLGLIPSPDLPAELTGKIVNQLPDLLKKHVDQSVSWEPEMIIDPLVGLAEYMNELMDKATQLKNINNWDFVICLTDLPQFMDKHIVISDISTNNKVALISIPAFGAFPLKKRIKQAICQILREMHDDSNQLDQQQTESMTRREYRNQNKKSLKDKLTPVKKINLAEAQDDLTDKNEKHPDPTLSQDEESELESNEESDDKSGDSKDTETQEDTEINTDIRYIVKSKRLGHLRILAGMTFANRPWTAFVSFKKVLVLAFGTGIYITLFPTPWELSTVYSIARFITAMVVAILSMMIWIIFAHNLWEKPTQKGDVRLRKLYNSTTISTLLLIVLINYIVLFCCFLGAIAIFVPPDLFEAGTKIENPSFDYYVKLTWLITSLGTLAGAIGVTSEDESKIRSITYSYRQVNRHYDLEDNKDDNDNDKEQTNMVELLKN